MLLSLERQITTWWRHRSAQYWLLAGIVLLAAALRFFKLGEWSFWIDEIFTINRAADIVRFTVTWPPVLPTLSVLSTHFVVSWLGTTELTARLVAAAVGIATIPLLYFPIRRIFSPAVGLIAVLLLAVSPWHLYWSQNARFYTTLLLFSSLAYFFFYLGLEEGKRRYLALTIPLLFLAAGERLTGLLILPVMLLYLLLVQIGPFAGGSRLPWKWLAAVGGLISLIIGYDIYRYITTGYSLLLSTFETFFGQSIDDPVRLLTFIIFNIGLPVMVMGAAGGVSLLLQRDRAGLYVTVGAAVPILLGIVLSLFAFFKDRYVFPSLINWFILAAVAIQALWHHLPGRNKWLAAAVLAVLVADGLWTDMLYFTVNNGHRRDWRGAFALIEERRGPEDRVASSWAQIGDYYLSTDVVWMGELAPEEVTASEQVYWFVADSESVWVTGPVWPWVQTHAELIDKKVLRMPEDMTLWIYRYEPQTDGGEAER